VYIPFFSFKVHCHAMLEIYPTGTEIEKRILCQW
jgi:hypothetical protein